jgi:hypothetical protein
VKLRSWLKKLLKKGFMPEVGGIPGLMLKAVLNLWKLFVLICAPVLFLYLFDRAPKKDNISEQTDKD